MTTSAFQEALSELHRLGCQPIKTGSGFDAYCPLHETDGKGHKRSLGVKTGDKQDVLVNCRAGCDSREILKVLGVNGTSRHSANLVATYRYRDADGREVRQKVRFEPKDFRIRHQDAAGQWVYKTGDGPAVLYRLPELKAAIKEGKTVFVVEGEKDADKLAALGLAATTNIEGAAQPNQRAKWRAEYTDQLAGAARVVLLPDNDAPGRAHMAHIAGQMAGRVADLRILELSGLPEKGDVSDWLKAGHAAEELEALAEGAPRAESKPAKPVQADHHAGAHDPLWRVDLITDDDDKPVKTHYNAVLIAEHAYPGLIGFNEFSGQIEARTPAPWRAEPGPWIDYDTQELAFHIVKEPHYLPALRLTMLETAVQTAARRHRFNPAQERLKAMAAGWDGEPRLGSWLVDHLNAHETDRNRDYLREAGAAWLKGVAARVLFPGCKSDNVLTLIGPQGYRKSSAAAAIADCIAPNSFADSLPPLGSDEAANVLRGCTIAEFSDLAGLSRSDVETIKAFISRKSDRFREKYARYPEDHPRTVSFIATSNEDCGFLRDPSGNRRWWPITLTAPIDTDRLQAALPQLLGEAAKRVLDGEPWHVTDRAALQQAEEIREEHSESDVWESAVLNAASRLHDKARSIGAILADMGIELSRHDRASQNRVSAILRASGYRRTRGRTTAGELAYLWVKPPADTPNPDATANVVPINNRGEQEGNTFKASQTADVPYVPICSYQKENKKFNEGTKAHRETVSESENAMAKKIFIGNEGNRGEQGEQGEQKPPNTRRGSAFLSHQIPVDI
ncbi:MAG: VapE domain-containing protein, partial [Candidatus Competibacter sp.]